MLSLRSLMMTLALCGAIAAYIRADIERVTRQREIEHALYVEEGRAKLGGFSMCVAIEMLRHTQRQRDHDLERFPARFPDDERPAWATDRPPWRDPSGNYLPTQNDSPR